MNSVIALYNTWSIFFLTERYLRKAKKNPQRLTDLKMVWAQNILSIVNIEAELIGHPSNSKSMLFIGNHVSYLDIPLLMAVCKDISFVSKSEIRKWLVIGRAAELIGTVFVQREKKDSHNQAKETIARELKNNKRIALFPSGTTSMNESNAWKQGSFQIARDSGTLIQPFRITYTPLRTAAYINDDSFLSHLFNLFKSKKITAKIEFHQPVSVNNVELDCLHWHNWSRGLIDETTTEV